MRISVLLSLIVLVIAPAAQAQDFSALSRLHAAAPRLAEPKRLPSAPRVLIAGDSWAQFMWDDGAHDTLLERFGLSDQSSLSLSLGSNPGTGYSGPEYAISGSEAREWANTASYPWIANVVSTLQANPTIDWVILSIGGNDALAGRSGGGWYKDMDLDVPGSEQAFFDQLEVDTFVIIDAVLAVRPDIRVMISSYDYPNFNVGFWCFTFACPKRDDLSRDPNNDLITDAEINALMVDVETRRRDWAANNARVVLDNSIGLMHHVYGDGATGPRLLARPGVAAPDYLPFPGGNPLLPSLRDNFRLAGILDADPIHLTPEGYRHKAGQQVWAHVLRGVVPVPDLRLQSVGGATDGWTNGISVSTSELSVGDDGTNRVASILQFDTAAITPGATVTGATLWFTRTGASGPNPFATQSLGNAKLDLSTSGFGTPGVVEPGDLDAAADATDVGTFVGTVSGNGATLRVDLGSSALSILGGSNLTEFRISFDSIDAGEGRVVLADGDVGTWTPNGLSTFAETLGSAAPVLELLVDTTTPAPLPLATTVTLHAPRPNPFNPATEISFELTRRAHARLTVHDVRGRLVRVLKDGDFQAGIHRLRWDGRDDRGAPLASGAYLVRAFAQGEVAVQRAILVR